MAIPLPGRAGLDKDLAEGAIALRHGLHANPEPSNQEKGTAQRIRRFLARHGLQPMGTGVGGHGLLYRVVGDRPGPHRLFRADLDGLPIHEATAVKHRSRRAGAHHACGHDGHMAMLAGALAHLHAHPDFPGEVLGLFQPAEETGEGASRVVADLVRRRLRIDQAIAIHNLPGLPLGAVGVRTGVAARASVGLTFTCTGRRGHASEPDRAANPLPVLARLALELQPRAEVADRFAGRTLETLVGWRSEGPNFGVSPGMASLSLTLRGDRTSDVERRQARVVALARRLAAASGQRIAVQEHDPFPHTANDAGVVAQVRRAARAVGLPLPRQAHPLSASEDFGHFTARWPGALVLLGAGLRQAPLHTARYDFPDGLVAPGIRLWMRLAGARRA